MTSHFKKLASTSAVAIALAGTAVSAGAAVVSSASEALLIPLVVWSPGSVNNPGGPFRGYTPAVDTLIEVVIPSSVGFDDVPNIFTARHTTPTNVPTALTPADPDLLGPQAQLHWYWFNRRSVEQASGPVEVSPDDVVQLSWTELANGQFANEPGYMVIGNESARSGAAAVFSMFGNAWITGDIHIPTVFSPPGTVGVGFPLIGGSIPVLGMNDGADGPQVNNICAQPDWRDSVKYKGLSPCAVSPVVAGFRTNRSDGDYDLFAFDVALSNRLVPTIQVIWLDQNLGGPNPSNIVGPNSAYPGNTAKPNPIARVNVFDVDENACNTSLRLPNELNVVWIPPAFDIDPTNPLVPWDWPFLWTTIADPLCAPTNANPGALFNSGFVQYNMDEYIDTNVDKSESAAYAFSLKVDGGVVSDNAAEIPNTFVLMLESSLGHDLGTFKF
jgi:hypothetical protein